MNREGPVEAVQRFAAAAKLVSPGYDAEALVYLDRKADAHYHQGEELEDNEALLPKLMRKLRPAPIL